VLELHDGIRKSDKHQLLTWIYTKPNIRWLVHSCNTFGAKTTHMQIRTHKTHHGPDLGEATTFPLIIYYVPLHEAHIQMGVLKFPKLGLLQLWSPITLCADLRLRWSPWQSCNPRLELSNNMSHTTCMQGNRVNF
jgi:hypothetical protein